MTEMVLFATQVEEKFHYPIRYFSSQIMIRHALEWCFEKMGDDAIGPEGEEQDHSWKFNPEARWTYLNPMKDEATFMFKEEKDALMFKLRWYGASD
jgi:hypothetical protein